MRIGIVGGTGPQGKGIALRLARKHEIIIGSRNADRAREIAETLNENATAHAVRGAKNEDACDAADVVIITVPYSVQRQTLLELRDHVQGKVVIDVTVALAEGAPTKYEPQGAASAGLQAQDVLGDGVRLAAAFHNISAHALAAVDKPLEFDVLVCGDDDEAKQTAIELATDLGCRAFDAGPMENTATVEAITALIIGLNIRYKRRSIGIRLTGI